jgi:hypothetical protein
MSFDERMALYKKKYDTTEQGPGRKASGSDRKSPSKSGGRKPARSKKTPPPKQPEQAVPPTPAKKGLFSRFVGMFRRRET